MKDAPLTTCTCGKKGKVRRKIGGGAGLIFKGSGFYETDYKRSSVGAKPSESKVSSSKDSSKASKPAA
jgi:predicted nucleic acid-binding Zn ribbon protein